jgi:hypothetical protein
MHGDLEKSQAREPRHVPRKLAQLVFGVWGLGFRTYGLGFRVYGLGFRV